MEFEWDTQKAAHNFRKHGIDFSEAATVFVDPLSVTYSDPDHSIDEERYIIRHYTDLIPWSDRMTG